METSKTSINRAVGSCVRRLFFYKTWPYWTNA